MNVKKILMCISIIGVLLGCSQNKDIKTSKVEKQEKVEVKKIKSDDFKLEIIKANEFIDLDKDSVKFLFKTEVGSKVGVLLSADGKEFTIKKTNAEYKNSGIKVDGLVTGETYFYKIISEFKGVTTISAVNSFVKLDRKKVGNANWAKDAVFYEIFVRAFYDSNGDGIGDFKGVTEKLDYLNELGVNALWLMPIMKTSTYHGYDTDDYYNVNSELGTIDDFREMITEAHKKGIRVIIDMVVNHSGLNNQWFVEDSSVNGKHEFYVWQDKFDDPNGEGTWGQPIWWGNGKEKYMGIFWSGMPDLNYRNPVVRAEMKKVAKFWLDKGVDGFRLDASRHIDDTDMEVTHSWWKEYNEYVKSINPNAFLVGEAWDSDVNFVAKFFGDMDSSFDFALSDAISEMISNPKKYEDIIEIIEKEKLAYSRENEEYINSIFLKNHDMDRIVSEFKGNQEKAKLAAAILLTLPGTPFLYYGDEIGQKGKKPDENLREPFDWYTSATGIGMTQMKKWNNREIYTKSGDGVSLEEEILNNKSIYNYYKKLIAFRKENLNVFKITPVKILQENKIYGYEYKVQDGVVRIVHNLDKESKLYSNFGEGYKNIEECLTGASVNEYTIPPYGTLILKLKN